jgi:hypothetical protein
MSIARQRRPLCSAAKSVVPEPTNGVVDRGTRRQVVADRALKEKDRLLARVVEFCVRAFAAELRGWRRPDRALIAAAKKPKAGSPAAEHEAWLV